MQTELDLDMSMVLSKFFLRSIGLWISENSAEERRMKIMIIYTVLHSIFATVEITRDFYFTIFYKGDILYVTTNILTVTMGLIKICIIMAHKEEFINLIVYVRQHFWNVKYNFREKEILDDCRKTCTFFVCSVTIMGACAIVAYLITPVIANAGKNNSERVLPFNIWLNLPVSMSPYYEMIFTLQMINMYQIAVTYFCFDNIFCILAIHLAGQFRILRYRFSKLCDIEHQINEKDMELTITNYAHTFYKQLKMYIRHHQELINFCDRLENVYTMLILGQVLVFSVLICLFAYQGLLFLLKLAGVWMTVNNAEERRRRLTMAFTAVIHVYGLYLNLGDAYYTWNDLSHCTFLLSNTLCIILAMFKLLILNFRRTEFKDLVLFAQENFWHFKYDHDEKILFMKCRKLCKLWTITACSFTQASLAFYIITPICANIGKNKSDRVLPFKMWVDLPLSVTPYYEIMFVIQLATVQQIGVTYLCNDNFLCILNMHVICQFRMLHNRLLNLWKIIDQKTDKIDYADKCYIALKKCIRQHQSLIKFCEKLEYVNTFPIFGHVVVFSLLMCFDTYEILLANVSTGTRLIFVFHMVGSFIHIIFFTYTCHGLIEESSNISLATYSGWWTILPMTETGRMLREDVKVMMMKSMRPCYLSAGGFFPISLETSTALMSTTMSYFTLMRESSVKNADK
uniref:odorant receptor 13a-like n=1 Tax=Bombus vancouverensis nearcticus TaxID=2705178 RepID=UPI00143B7246|nr:odorant receptor 13a-like [Bombus vancouverensis nearcticus]